MIGTDGVRESGNTMLSVWLDGDIYIYRYIYIYIYIYISWEKGIKQIWIFLLCYLMAFIYIIYIYIYI